MTINLTEIKKQIQKESANRNFYSLPTLQKVVINYRLPEVRESPDKLQEAINEIMAITGQKPKVCRAKKAISAFKLRQNDILALKVTLRQTRMHDFIEKLFNLVLPRLRDFKGLSPTAFDQNGNYSLIIKDQTYFPEIDLDKINKIRSVQITFVLHASSQNDAKMLLSALGLPFTK